MTRASTPGTPPPALLLTFACPCLNVKIHSGVPSSQVEEDERGLDDLLTTETVPEAASVSETDLSEDNKSISLKGWRIPLALGGIVVEQPKLCLPRQYSPVSNWIHLYCVNCRSFVYSYFSTALEEIDRSDREPTSKSPDGSDSSTTILNEKKSLFEKLYYYPPDEYVLHPPKSANASAPEVLVHTCAVYGQAYQGHKQHPSFSTFYRLILDKAYLQDIPEDTTLPSFPLNIPQIDIKSTHDNLRQNLEVSLNREKHRMDQNIDAYKKRLVSEYEEFSSKTRKDQELLWERIQSVVVGSNIGGVEITRGADSVQPIRRSSSGGESNQPQPEPPVQLYEAKGRSGKLHPMRQTSTGPANGTSDNTTRNGSHRVRFNEIPTATEVEDAQEGDEQHPQPAEPQSRPRQSSVQEAFFRSRSTRHPREDDVDASSSTSPARSLSSTPLLYSLATFKRVDVNAAQATPASSDLLRRTDEAQSPQPLAGDSPSLVQNPSLSSNTHTSGRNSLQMDEHSLLGSWRSKDLESTFMKEAHLRAGKRVSDQEGELASGDQPAELESGDGANKQLENEDDKLREDDDNMEEEESDKFFAMDEELEAAHIWQSKFDQMRRRNSMEMRRRSSAGRPSVVEMLTVSRSLSLTPYLPPLTDDHEDEEEEGEREEDKGSEDSIEYDMSRYATSAPVPIRYLGKPIDDQNMGQHIVPAPTADETVEEDGHVEFHADGSMTVHSQHVHHPVQDDYDRLPASWRQIANFGQRT